MPILFCPQFSLTLLLLLILISPISSSQDLREAQSFGLGSPWWFFSSFWALGSLAGAFGSNKDDGVSEIRDICQHQAISLEPLETSLSSYNPLLPLLSQDLISSQSDQGGVSVRTLQLQIIETQLKLAQTKKGEEKRKGSELLSEGSYGQSLGKERKSWPRDKYHQRLKSHQSAPSFIPIFPFEPAQLSFLSQLKGRVGKMYQTEQLAAPEAHVLVVQTPGGGERCFPTNSSLQNLRNLIGSTQVM